MNYDKEQYRLKVRMIKNLSSICTERFYVSCVCVCNPRTRIRFPACARIPVFVLVLGASETSDAISVSCLRTDSGVRSCHRLREHKFLTEVSELVLDRDIYKIFLLTMAKPLASNLVCRTPRDRNTN